MPDFKSRPPPNPKEEEEYVPVRDATFEVEKKQRPSDPLPQQPLQPENKERGARRTRPPNVSINQKSIKCKPTRIERLAQCHREPDEKTLTDPISLDDLTEDKLNEILG